MSKIIPGSVKNNVVASDLLEERAKLAFDAEEMSVFTSGGPEVYAVQKKWNDVMSAHKPLHNTFEFYDMSVHEQQTALWAKVRYIDENMPDILKKSKVNEYPFYFWMNRMQGLLPGIGLHLSMFQAVMAAMCDEEQKKYWTPLIEDHKIMGCYAQTEIGHGSNVAGLETTATLDKSTDEFVINSPTPTSTKYWPGDLGRFSTHGVVFARLLVDGNDYGVNAFVVQFRDLETYQRVKGFNSGDMGPKFGYHSKDNGWATFDNVRIPRRNMLMGIAQVSKEGDFSINGDPKVLYTTMMLIRTSIVIDCPMFSMISLKVALRYGSVRRQFSTIKGKREERKIIDYQTFQSTLTPLVAVYLSQHVVGSFIRESFRDMKEKIAKGNYDTMPVLHHLLAGLKAQITEWMMHTIDKARRCCGGAGYQSNSGFTELHSGASPIPTYEGDNIVMSLQAARFVFKLVKQASKGKKLPYPFQYIAEAQKLKSVKGKGKSMEDMMNADTIEMALAVRALTQIENTAQAIATSEQPDKVKDNELFARMKLDMIRVHLEYLTLHMFKTHVMSAKIKDERIREIMIDNFKIAGLHMLSLDCGDLFDSEFFAPSANKMMRLAQDKLIAKMRPQLIPLIESVVMYEIPSNIGNFHGDCYELQLAQAKDSKMNKLDVNGVPPQWENYIKPLLHGSPYPKL